MKTKLPTERKRKADFQACSSSQFRQKFIHTYTHLYLLICTDSLFFSFFFENLLKRYAVTENTTTIVFFRFLLLFLLLLLLFIGICVYRTVLHWFDKDVIKNKDKQLDVSCSCFSTTMLKSKIGDVRNQRSMIDYLQWNLKKQMK